MDVERGASARMNPALPAADPRASGRIPAMRRRHRDLPHGYSVRPMASEDLAFVVEEHRKHFPEGFFARLGPRFLATYTASYAASPYARAYVAEEDGRPVGFLVGVLDPAQHRRFVLRGFGGKLAALACAGLSRRPRLALHFLRTRLVRYGGKLLSSRRGSSARSGGHQAGVTAVLAHVAVVDAVRSRGLGSTLIRCFVREAAEAGCARASLVTAAGVVGAGSYYERQGWRYAGWSRTPEGRLLLAYELPLAEAPAEAEYAR